MVPVCFRITGMFRIDFPFTDAHLLLTPRLGGMSRYLQVGLLRLILGVLLYLIFRLYRHELSSSPAGSRSCCSGFGSP